MSALVSKGSKYTDEDRRRAVSEYASTGALSSVSATTGISRRTLADWLKSEWWGRLTAELRHEDGELISTGEPITHTSERLVQCGSAYTDSQRREACLLYSIEGVMTRVSRALNIPLQTLYGWKNQSSWWPELTEQVRLETEDHIKSQLSKVVELANANTIERLEKGDVQYIQGKKKFVPMKGKESMVITGIGVEKLQLLNNRPTAISCKQETLTDLLEQFRAISRAIHKEEKVVAA